MIKGIYAASMSILNKDLTLNINKTIEHAELVIDQGCHGVAIFGSTGQSQLIPISEKINFLNKLATNKYKDKYLIGTGLNSLGDTISLMKVAMSLDFETFLIMPPAYYIYGDKEVIDFYSKLVEALPSRAIISRESLNNSSLSASLTELKEDSSSVSSLITSSSNSGNPCCLSELTISSISLSEINGP